MKIISLDVEYTGVEPEMSASLDKKKNTVWLDFTCPVQTFKMSLTDAEKLGTALIMWATRRKIESKK